MRLREQLLFRANDLVQLVITILTGIAFLFAAYRVCAADLIDCAQLARDVRCYEKFGYFRGCRLQFRSVLHLKLVQGLLSTARREQLGPILGSEKFLRGKNFFPACQEKRPVVLDLPPTSRGVRAAKLALKAFPLGLRYCKKSRPEFRAGQPVCTDCSFIPHYAYGGKIPRTAREQCAKALKPNKAKISVGALVCMSSAHLVDHVGVVVQCRGSVALCVLHASVQKGIVIQPLSAFISRTRFFGKTLVGIVPVNMLGLGG